MRVLITENRMINLIKKFILNNYPMVADVYFTPETVYLGGGPNHKGESGLFTRTVIHIVYINGKMEYSPTLITRRIYKELNDLFGLRITDYGSYWTIEDEWLKE